MNNNLLKHNAKKHFLNAGICFLARGDFVAGENFSVRSVLLPVNTDVAAKNGLQRFGELDYTFGESRQGKSWFGWSDRRMMTYGVVCCSLREAASIAY